MDADDGVTVGVAAQRAGVTVRTLHHWDHVGLVRPSGRSAAGYRLYDDADQERIRRVVAYQHAGLGLDAIADLLDRPADRIGDALADQRRLLAGRIAELTALDDELARIATAHERGILLPPEEQAEVFGADWQPERTAQAHERWGSTLQWAQFAERSAGRSRDEWEALARDMRALEADFAAAVADGVPPDDERAGALVERHRELFGQFFPISRQMQVCLGRMYAADEGFAAHYDAVHPGLASWLRDAIDASARAHGIDPDTATWGWPDATGY